VSKQTTIQADIVKGRVVDAETKEPLPEASVKLTQRYGDYGTMINSLKADSLGCFSVFASGRGSIEVSMLGYYSKSKPVLAFSDSRKDTLDIGTIELKMSPQMLKMVQVTGRARRFTVKGDTLVIGEKGNTTFTGTGTHTISVSIDDDGQYVYKVMPGDQTQQEEPSTPKPTELKVYDKEKQEVLSTLTKTGDGIYSGSLEAKWGWFNFLVYDAENSIWYGSDPADATMLSSEEGFYNLWIPADITGIFTITVDLNTMKWTFERTGDLPPAARKAAARR